MPTKYQAILFDLDGTLIDSAPDLAKTLNDMLAKRNQAAVPYEKIRPLVSYGSSKLLDLAFADNSDAEKNALREEFLSLYKTQNCVKTDFFPSVPELLNTIEASNTLWGIITNKYTDCTENIVNTLGLSQRTKAIVCGDTLPVAKPNPEPLLYACELLNVEPTRCVYIGDCIRDIQAGKAAGMATIACEYGYTDGQDVATWQADYIAKNPAQIINFL